MMYISTLIYIDTSMYLYFNDIHTVMSVSPKVYLFRKEYLYLHQY